jgi:hypothetical protein
MDSHAFKIFRIFAASKYKALILRFRIQTINISKSIRMKKPSFKSLLAVAALFLAIGTLSSCNRGYGCPDITVNTKTVQVVNHAIQSLANHD